MANPNPQHNPTDGLGVAAIVLVTGSGVTKVGSTVARNVGVTAGGHQYALTLSLGGTNTCQLTTIITDVLGNTYTTVGSPVYKSYNNPSAGSPAWYNPKRFAGYNDNVASVSGSGLITGIAVGQAVIEVQFPTFDNTIGADSDTANPDEMIYSQILVTVTP